MRTDPQDFAPERPAFDDLGRPVVVTDPPTFDGPEAEPGDGLDVEQVISLLLHGARDAREAGERTVILAYLMPRVEGGPRTTRELAAWLGCSHTAARGRLSRLLQCFRDELRPHLSKTPVGKA